VNISKDTDIISKNKKGETIEEIKNYVNNNPRPKDIEKRAYNLSKKRISEEEITYINTKIAKQITEHMKKK
jgi:hypothetical protein